MYVTGLILEETLAVSVTVFLHAVLKYFTIWIRIQEKIERSQKYTGFDNLCLNPSFSFFGLSQVYYFLSF
jgi:hypothetical protein